MTPRFGPQAVAIWRNCDTLLLWDQRRATPAWRRTPPVRALHVRHAPPAAAETCTALTWQRGAVAKRSLIRLRKQKLLRQVFERLQDGLLCTFLEADGLEADERRVVGDQAVDASLNLFHLQGLLESLAQHP